MKRLNILFALMLAVTTLFAQVPSQFTYQAVVRDANGSLLANGNVGLRLTLLQGSATGTTVWTSSQMVTTNANGLFTVAVGAGGASLDDVDWSQGPYFLKSEVDPTGGNNYTVSTIQQLISVPYAMRAATVESHSLADAASQGNAVQSQIKQLSDPTEDLDAVNLRTLNAALALMQQRIDSISGGNGGGSGQATGDWVDLGLPSGLLWATHNVGATNPEDFGDYYAWGETTTKQTYNWSTYAYGSDNNQLTKYCNSSNYGLNGYSDTLTILQAVDDAATTNLGDGIRTPTREEWQELIDNTTAICTTRNGVSGLLLTASNGRSIFLPAAGHRQDGGIYSVQSRLLYWSSSVGTNDNPESPCIDTPDFAWDFRFPYEFNPEIHAMCNSFRWQGFPVRAVRQN